MQEMFSYAIAAGHVNLLDVLWSLKLEMGLVLLNAVLCVWGLGLEMKERRRDAGEVRG